MMEWTYLVARMTLLWRRSALAAFSKDTLGRDDLVRKVNKCLAQTTATLGQQRHPYHYQRVLQGMGLETVGVLMIQEAYAIRH